MALAGEGSAASQGDGLSPALPGPSLAVSSAGPCLRGWSEIPKAFEHFWKQLCGATETLKIPGSIMFTQIVVQDFHGVQVPGEDPQGTVGIRG